MNADTGEYPPTTAPTSTTIMPFDARTLDTIQTLKDSVLMSHVSQENEVAMIDYLNNGARLECRNHFGETPLIIAAIRENIRMVALLLDRGADPNAENLAKFTALMYTKKTAVANLLIFRGAKIDAKNVMGKTALMHASEIGNEEVVKCLLERGADPNAQDSGGRTALMHAAEKGMRNVLVLLRDRGACIDTRDNDGNTALSLVLMQLGPEIYNMPYSDDLIQLD